MNHPTPSTLEEFWRTRGVDPSRLSVDDSGTMLAPNERAALELADLVATLPRLLDELTLGAAIGEGGMGEVRLGVQRALDREVAVKIARTSTNLTTTVQLLREARVTGLLEHPNIVPVHALGRDERDQPVLVMKRIEGSAWSELIFSRPAQGSADNLGFHLDVLVQVARAVSFAHARGVLHLDLKPDNVMIGAFGEVYVLDWGVAARISGPSGKLDIPLAADIDHIVGTPQYMSPEMASAQGIALTPRTDVFLLGACLHEVLTGEPPHDGATIREVLESAFIAEAHHYDARWPHELVDVCQRAMHRHQEHRHATAGDFAAAIEAFRKHRHSNELADEACRQLTKLEAAMGEDGAASDDPEARRVVYDTFGACRFGFHQALRDDPQNRTARRGLQRCLQRMIDYELKSGAAGAAAAYLNELPRPNDKLAQRVDSARRRDVQKKAALELLRRDADVTVGDRVRGVVALAIGGLWSGAHFALGWYQRRGGHLEPWHMMVICAVFLAASVTLAVGGRRVFFDTSANTRTSWGLIVAYLGYCAAFGVAQAFGLSIGPTLAFVCIASAMIWAAIALGSDRRLLPLPAAVGSTAFAITMLPRYALELMGIGSLVGPIAVSLMWLRTTPPKERTKPRQSPVETETSAQQRKPVE